MKLMSVIAAGLKGLANGLLLATGAINPHTYMETTKSEQHRKRAAAKYDFSSIVPDTRSSIACAVPRVRASSKVAIVRGTSKSDPSTSLPSPAIADAMKQRALPAVDSAVLVATPITSSSDPLNEKISWTEAVKEFSAHGTAGFTKGAVSTLESAKSDANLNRSIETSADAPAINLENSDPSSVASTNTESSSTPSITGSSNLSRDAAWLALPRWVRNVKSRAAATGSRASAAVRRAVRSSKSGDSKTLSLPRIFSHPDFDDTVAGLLEAMAEHGDRSADPRPASWLSGAPGRSIEVKQDAAKGILGLRRTTKQRESRWYISLLRGIETHAPDVLVDAMGVWLRSLPAPMLTEDTMARLLDLVSKHAAAMSQHMWSLDRGMPHFDSYLDPSPSATAPAIAALDAEFVEHALELFGTEQLAEDLAGYFWYLGRVRERLLLLPMPITERNRAVAAVAVMQLTQVDPFAGGKAWADVSESTRSAMALMMFLIDTLDRVAAVRGSL
ncbi:hypothetical protein H9P43_004688 [Blastocladiella emersonii ATCC 22665]|nr:hypothetical protein H9P43_004688 [Blastocladiella emersonii ATCC 22665]